MKKFIKDYNHEELVDFFTQIGEKEYRARQLINWLYEKNVDDFSLMTNFSKELRKFLDDEFILSPLTIEDRLISGIDGTEKYLFKTFDNHYIESVLIKNEMSDEGRLTVCISSQVGCPMGCRFCETAKIGFVRNLSCGEILDQICHVRRISGLKNNNIVFMGMGEPFLNYDNVLKAADIMNYSFGFHLSVRKITISTSGIYPAIERFIDERRPYNIALSLNDTEPSKRLENMPVEKKYPFKMISDLLSEKTTASRNRITIEYVMRKDNISKEDAKRLKKMFKYANIKLNLIPLNEGNHNLPIPTKEEIEDFVKELEIMNVPVSIRKSMGSDISGACGQLSGKKYKQEKELLCK
ncbi:MAG TPA: 23S rRNA (adenine(2503)-C(2))-methyltransferase RlmN [Spirochaetota bacterium]|nr:23S rRNA (adenine(2503)-C(2))-methyltransferase RlmN [Spirochaetota bacterium]